MSRRGLVEPNFYLTDCGLGMLARRPSLRPRSNLLLRKCLGLLQAKRSQTFDPQIVIVDTRHEGK
jgi:hypothetical protein